MECRRALDAALSLARAGLPVFPCLATKAPACPTGFKAAIKHETVLKALWRAYPGPLVGMATGEASGFDVLDLDLCADGQPDGAAWWMQHGEKLPATFSYLTRSGGLHLWFRHAPGLRNSAGKIAPGVDVRADGGFVIHWPSAGCEVLTREPPAPWPAWLLDALAGSPAPRTAVALPAMPSGDAGRRYALAALRSGVQRVAIAAEGTRNEALNREAFVLARFIGTGALTASELARAMAVAGLGAGLSDGETEATISSALRARAAA